jgi:large subunit ribosomal protein L11
MAFVKEYNERTSSQAGTIVPVQLTVFEDRSFAFVTKTPPASDLLRKALGVEKGGAQAGRASLGSVRRSSVREIAELKMKDLNAATVESAMKIIEGTAQSMGIAVAED